MFETCSGGIGNTASKLCPTGAPTTKIIFVAKYDETGQRNGISLADAIAGLDLATITAKLNYLNPSQRWFPSPTLRGIEDVRAEDVTEELDGFAFSVKDGNRTFSCIAPNEGSVLKGELDKGKFTDMCVYLINTKGDLTGIVSNDGQTLFPLPIAQGTLQVILQPATQTTVQKLQITFTFDNTFSDSELRTIKASKFGTEMKDINGLFDIVIASPAIDADNINFGVHLSYGAFGSPIAAEGIEQSSVTVNDSTGASVIVTGLIEESPGGYSLETAGLSGIAPYTVTISQNGYTVTSFEVNFNVD